MFGKFEFSIWRVPSLLLMRFWLSKNCNFWNGLIQNYRSLTDIHIRNISNLKHKTYYSNQSSNSGKPVSFLCQVVFMSRQNVLDLVWNWTCKTKNSLYNWLTVLPSWFESTYYFSWVGKTAANSGCIPRHWWNTTNKIWIGSRFGSTNRLIFHHINIFLKTNKMQSLFFRKNLFCHSRLTLKSLL